MDRQTQEPINQFLNQLPDFFQPAVESARVIYRHAKRGPKRYVSDLLWGINQRRLKARAASLTTEEKIKIGEELKRNDFPNATPRITGTFGSRQLGNRDNEFRRFLDSFLTTADDPLRTEFLVKIDDDDDLQSFVELKRDYGKRVNIRFYLSPRGAGYGDINKWHHILKDFRSPSSYGLLILSEDVLYEKPGWDERFAKTVEIRGNTFFVGTAFSFEESKKILGPMPKEPEPVYWIHGDDFPFFGSELLDVLDKAAKVYSDPEWNTFGNIFSLDSFSGEVLRRAWDLHQTNLHLQLEPFARRRGVYDWTTSPERSHTRNSSLLKFFSPEFQKRRDEMITLSVKCYKDKQQGALY